MSLPHYFQDLSIPHINTTPHHAYFIPHATHKSAVENHYRFFSYGDAMFITKKTG